MNNSWRDLGRRVGELEENGGGGGGITEVPTLQEVLEKGNESTVNVVVTGQENQTSLTQNAIMHSGSQGNNNISFGDGIYMSAGLASLKLGQQNVVTNKPLIAPNAIKATEVMNKGQVDALITSLQSTITALTARVTALEEAGA